MNTHTASTGGRRLGARPSPLLTVSALAHRSALDAQVVRYYARIRLLEPAAVGANGYRRFEQSDVDRLRFIKAAQRLGFTLAEIGEVIRRSRRREAPCPWVRDVLAKRVSQKAEQFEVMRRQIAHMRASLEHWRRLPDGAPTGTQICALIDAVAGLEPHRNSGASHES